MHLTMLIRFWLVTRPTWMKARGLCPLQRDKHLLMNTASSFLKLVQRRTLMWSKFSFQLLETSSKGLPQLMQRQRTRPSRLTNQTGLPVRLSRRQSSSCCG